jgi:hypothetical protein
MASKIYVTERTSKRWKTLQGVGFLASLAGIALVIAGTTLISRPAGQGPATFALSTTSIIGIAAFLGGVGLNLFGRLGGWWYHG